MNNSERGAIAIYLAAIIGILLVTTTTYASKIMVSEISQSSQTDRGEAAYYAAEAGMEDAIRRMEKAVSENGGQGLAQAIASAGLPDSATLKAQDMGKWSASAGNVATNNDLSWSRKVYPGSSMTGSLVKDESAQFDLSDLRRDCSGTTYGTKDEDCDGSYIYSNLSGFNFCWNTPDQTPDNLEMTVISWKVTPEIWAGVKPKLSISSDVKTQKVLFSGSRTPNFCNNPDGNQYDWGYHYDTDDNQLELFDPNRRYLLRIKPLYTRNIGECGVDLDCQNSNTIDYNFIVLDKNPNYAGSTAGGNHLYIPSGYILIDSVGRSGDIRRRIIARRDLNGRLIGIFDYVLYSGDPEKALCKAGPGGYNIYNCTR